MKIFLICLLILTRVTQLLSLRNFKLFSLTIRRTWSNSGNVPVIAIGFFIKWLALRPNCSILSHSSLANHLGISAKRKNAMSLLTDGRWSFRHLIWKEKVFSTSLTVMTRLSNQLISKAVHSSNTSATLTLCVQELWEWLQITVQSVNIGLGSSLERTLVVYAGYTTLSQEDISFMSVEGSTNIGI